MLIDIEYDMFLGNMFVATIEVYCMRSIVDSCM